MTRGNQREKAREKNLAAQGGAKKNTQSGTEYQKTKEAAAQIMREKQAAGGLVHFLFFRAIPVALDV